MIDSLICTQVRPELLKREVNRWRNLNANYSNPEVSPLVSTASASAGSMPSLKMSPSFLSFMEEKCLAKADLSADGWNVEDDDNDDNAQLDGVIAVLSSRGGFTKLKQSFKQRFETCVKKSRMK
jgi:hypothetical protein